MVVFQWWTYLWLNEGFATLYEYYMVHLTYPEDRYDDSYLVDMLQRALEIDANPNIRAMSIYVEDPWSIDMLFDWVAYPKGEFGASLQNFDPTTDVPLQLAAFSTHSCTLSVDRHGRMDCGITSVLVTIITQIPAIYMKISKLPSTKITLLVHWTLPR
jgi:hypothetical protein